MPELHDLADSRHQKTYGPRLSVLTSPGEEGQDSAILGTQMVEYVAQGRSDEQLAAFMDLVMRMNMRLFADIEERYPALVTWGMTDGLVEQARGEPDPLGECGPGGRLVHLPLLHL